MEALSFNLPARVASTLLEDPSIVWHQRFSLDADRLTPGVNSVAHLIRESGLSSNLTGKSVLDVGTTNGAIAFEAERRGAKRVVATDIFDDNHFGFGKIRRSLGSSVEFIRCSVYELDQVFENQTFDIVLFFGVLYHLRHPLLGLDAIRSVCNSVCLLETAIFQPEKSLASNPVAHFHRLDSLNGDSSNWFVPSIRALSDWCESAGFSTEILGTFPATEPKRCMARLAVRPGPPEYQRVSYERKIKVAPIWF